MGRNEKSIDYWIIRTRRQHAWTESELAALLKSFGYDISPKILSRIEKGDLQASPKQIAILYEILGMAVSELDSSVCGDRSKQKGKPLMGT